MQTIKSKLIISFLLFFSITAIWVGTTFWFDSKKNSIEEFKSHLLNIRLLFAESIRLEKDFFMFETINADYFKCEESFYLRQKKLNIILVKEQISKMKTKKETNNIKLNKRLDSLILLINQYENLFDSLVSFTLKKGFKNYGYEGQMREAIHLIENNKNNIVPPTLLLSLRRNEKDYMLRKEKQYVDNVLILAEQISVIAISKPNSAEALLISDEISRYLMFFEKIVATEKMIGIFERDGLRGRLAKMQSHIEKINSTIQNDVLVYAINTDTQIWNAMLIISVFSVVFMALLSFFAVRNLSLPVSNLSNSIHKVINSGFDENLPIVKIKGGDEIAKLSNDFILMFEQVKISMFQIREQAEELSASQLQILDSLRYAKTIQEALMPNSDEFDSFFAQHFIIYKPQHHVSGDFYWFYRKRQKTYIAVADCTGHGVPGAFMSLIGNMILAQIIELAKIYEPALMLETLDLELRKVLHQDKLKNDDGMDIAICTIEQANDDFKLTFSGAKRNIYVKKDNCLLKIRGNKRSIGGRQKTYQVAFENYEVFLPKGSAIYFYTDGFADQNNLQKEKYGSERFEHLIKKNMHLDLPEQKEALLAELEKFMQNQKQRDDITILGVEV